mgnify:CR=1 FL=1
MEEEREWNVKRVIVGITAIVILLGAGYAAKIYVLDKKGSVEGEASVNQAKTNNRIAAEQIPDDEDIEFISKEAAEQKIDTIKKDLTNLKPEDVVKQEPVQKILKDLESLKASTEKQVTDATKNAICEQAKRIFCSQ